MEIAFVLKGLLYLSGVITLIFVIAKMTQGYLKGNLSLYHTNERRIKINERTILDTKRTLIRFNDSHYSYLLLLGNQGEQLLDKELLSSRITHEKSV